MDLSVIRLDHADDLPLPTYASEGAAGLDLFAAVRADLSLPPLGRAPVPTGLVVAIPVGFEGQVRARSGRALREGLAVLNGPGTIDCDYRGEIQVLLVNLGEKLIAIRRGDRIAQLVIAPVARVRVIETPELRMTRRGGGGFGSTGV